MTINISVIGTLGPGNPGVGAHIQSDHPVNHLLHPNTAPGSYGVQVDTTFEGLAGLPGPLVGVGDGVSGISPAFLHLGFNSHPLGQAPGVYVFGTGTHTPHLPLPDVYPFGPGVASTDSTVVKLHNLMDHTK